MRSGRMSVAAPNRVSVFGLHHEIFAVVIKRLSWGGAEWHRVHAPRFQPMDTASTLPQPFEQRLLAAIVFTDASGFTARMEAQETAALRLLEEDFALMRELSKGLSGTVLKSTGDGLLLYFTSAVHAVTWALQAQRRFAERARGKNEREIFRHRVGVHVGDVIVRGDDVMGDGVNLAARVQAEAPPGGICISQVAYDVVKNKMELHVVRLEPRKLKNISAPVQMYQVLLEEPQRVVQSAPEVAPRMRRQTEPAPAPRGRSGRKAALIGLIIGGVGLGGYALWRSQQALEEEMAQSRAKQEALTAAFAARAGRSAAGGAEVPAGAQGGEAGMPVSVESWAQAELKRFAAERPLSVRKLAGAGDWSAFWDAGQVAVNEGGVKFRRGWADLRRDQQGEIIVALLRQTAAPSAELMRAAQAFGAEHGLPAMTEALLQDQRARAVLPR